MRKLFSTFGLLTVAVAAFAYGSYLKVAQETYNISPRSQAGKAKCMLCHANKSLRRLNAYGKDLKRVMKGSKTLTPNTMRKLDNWDSFGVGISNGDALRQGKKPG